MSDCSPIEPLLTSIRVRCPGVTDDTIKVELWSVINEFLRRTNAWKWDQAIDISSGDGEFALAVPGDARIVRVIGAEYNGVPVPMSNSGTTQSSTGTLQPELTFPDGDAAFAPRLIDVDPVSQIFSWAIYRPDYVTVANPPTDGQKYPFNLLASLSIAPKCMACECTDWELPDWMYDSYFEAWLDGVLGRLHSMPAKPWRDVVMAQYHGKRFRSAMGFHKQEAARGFQYANQTWRFPRSGW